MDGGFDLGRFQRERGPGWARLAAMLADLERPGGLRRLGMRGARRFGRLYRATAGDLVKARTERADAALLDHLNDLVARAYVFVHEPPSSPLARLRSFLLRGFPRLVRREIGAVLLSAGLLVGGAGLGAVAMLADPDGARVALIPDGHRERTPDERVAGEAAGGHRPEQATVFSSWLFTHNIRVSFLVFALGMTAGVGTVLVLLANGLPLGALAVQYHQAGQGLFFWAWILPHGIPELSAIALAGAAGLVLGRALWMPGRRRRGQALREDAPRAVQLVLGAMPILVVAGFVEGTVSQLHPPTLAFGTKLAVAALLGTALVSYLGLGGRRRSGTPPSPQ
jgi:uncharacterized membrane protein SpoIIM required for sporulation